jgi:hypothetical protein
MTVEKNYKVDFGQGKLKQNNKNLSLFGLAKIHLVIKSYLNRKLKRKNNQKTDKVILLSEKLDVSYDHMVSLSWIIICQLEKF